ncbi:hypothetical protein MAR_028651 [Mya arenaria]|uniref:Uncharacterized protein n=1 Tax=Mya arenaria TaxID=6604 RepID=A0ABY7DH69_MYAAR|nr:hypothetical protein MAR_028651 [Mya arenaria]
MFSLQDAALKVLSAIRKLRVVVIDIQHSHLHDLFCRSGTRLEVFSHSYLQKTQYHEIFQCVYTKSYPQNDIEASEVLSINRRDLCNCCRINIATPYIPVDLIINRNDIIASSISVELYAICICNALIWRIRSCERQSATVQRQNDSETGGILRHVTTDCMVPNSQPVVFEAEENKSIKQLDDHPKQASETVLKTADEIDKEPYHQPKETYGIWRKKAEDLLSWKKRLDSEENRTDEPRDITTTNSYSNGTFKDTRSQSQPSTPKSLAGTKER